MTCIFCVEVLRAADDGERDEGEVEAAPKSEYQDLYCKSLSKRTVKSTFLFQQDNRFKLVQWCACVVEILNPKKLIEYPGYNVAPSQDIIDVRCCLCRIHCL